MRYLGQVWGGKKPFDENFTGELKPAPISTYVSGFSKLLPGVKVGSRVMLILPPGQGYGSKGKRTPASRAPTPSSSSSMCSERTNPRRPRRRKVTKSEDRKSNRRNSSH